MKKIFFSYFSILTIFLSINFPSASLAQVIKVNNIKKDKAYQVPSKNQLIPSFADTVDELLPTVVNISTSQDLYNNRNSLDEDRLQIVEDLKKNNDSITSRDFESRRKITSIGSGFIISSDGYIVTNGHVIEDSNDINVNLYDGSKYKAKMIGIDKKTDLALLKINVNRELKYAKFGDSNQARIGDWAIVIGNPYGLGGSVSIGIISARGRDIKNGQSDEYIQTDAAINKGNSGGPLFNKNGDVVGITTAKLNSEAVGVDVQNVNYAIKAAYLSQMMEMIHIKPDIILPAISKGPNFEKYSIEALSKFIGIVVSEN
jgi:serine protease Do